jgi:hypothetical protein
MLEGTESSDWTRTSKFHIEYPQPDIADSAIYPREPIVRRDMKRNSYNKYSSNSEGSGDIPQPDQADQTLQPIVQFEYKSPTFDSQVVNSNKNMIKTKEFIADQGKENRENAISSNVNTRENKQEDIPINYGLPPKKRGRGRPKKEPTEEIVATNQIQVRIFHSNSFLLTN